MTDQYDHDQAVREMIAREQQETKVPFFKCPDCGFKFFGKVPPEICPECEQTKEFFQHRRLPPLS